MDYLETAKSIINTIKSHGYEAYIIGGAVRDHLLGLSLNDIDMTTNMPLNELLALYSNKDLDGKDYLGVRLEVDGYIFEVTNFRKDISYSDHRHPVVELANSLKDDVGRRDFTINALAMDEDLNVIDYVCGINDLNNNTIKMIGNPVKRFTEDALRILRACYFAGKLDFEIDSDTVNGMIECKKYIKELSDERIYEYVLKILYTNTDKGIEYIKNYDLLSEVLEYKELVEIFNSKIEKGDLPIYYAYKTGKELPITTSDEKKLINALNELINSNFSNEVLFYHQNSVIRLNKLFISLGYNGILEKGNSLRIKSERELALSPYEISQMFSRSDIKKAITATIKAILEGQINNSKEEINLFLKDLMLNDK